LKWLDKISEYLGLPTQSVSSKYDEAGFSGLQAHSLVLACIEWRSGCVYASLTEAHLRNPIFSAEFPASNKR
jgi:hypothetical protein